MSQNTNLSRRGFLKGIAASGLGAGALLSLNGADQKVPSIKSPSKAKNLILMVSDGMNNGVFSAANHWLNLTENRDSEWMCLYKNGLAQRRLVEASCADAIVTDSAAASSAWGIGQRVNHGVVNILPNGQEPLPLALLAKQKGKKAGMVSTARITHATPAGFAANVISRDLDPIIAEQYLDRKIDLLLGGGDKHFCPHAREDGRDLYADYKKSGYSVVKTKKELLSLPQGDKPLLGVFYKDHLPYYIDRRDQPEKYATVPSLEEMTSVALSRLSQHSEGFVLQIEAARVDHAAHANDAGTTLVEQLEFDRTIKLVRKFAEQNGETMVVVTTDHGTGGFMLNRSERGYVESGETLLKLSQIRGSHEWMDSQLDFDRLEQTLIPAFEKRIGESLNAGEKESLLTAATCSTSRGLYGANKALAKAMDPIIADRFGVSWTGFHHTADLVEMAMFGPGADILPGYIENWQLHDVIRECLKI